MRAISILSEHESDNILHNKIWSTILEFTGVHLSASVAGVNTFLRKVALLKYGFLNIDKSTGEIFNVIDESCFAAAWDFLQHAEYNLFSRIEDHQIRAQLIGPLLKKQKREFPPKEVKFDLFYYSTQPGNQNHHNILFSQFDNLMEILIPNAQLQQKSDYRINITSNRLRDLLGNMFQNDKALEILKEFLADVDKETGISSSTLCWKSALLWQVCRNDISLVKKIFKGLFFIVSSSLLIASFLVSAVAIAITFLGITLIANDPRLCRNNIFRCSLVVLICPFSALFQFGVFLNLFHCSIPKFSVLNDEQRNCVKQRLRFLEVCVLVLGERMGRLSTLYLLVMCSITLGKIISYSTSGKDTRSNWDSLGSDFLFFILSVVYHKLVTNCLKISKQQLSDASQYYRGNHWLRFFHNGIAKQKQEQESRFDTHVINIDADNFKKHR